MIFKKNFVPIILSVLTFLFFVNKIYATDLGQANSFAVLGGSTITNTGSSVITGDLGLYTGTSITGFPPGIINGTTNATDAVALHAQTDLTTTYNDVASRPCTENLTGQDLGGMTLTPGVYCFDTSAQLTGTLTLNGQGNADAVFIFKMGSTITTASGSSVSLINSAQSCNVFWQVGSSATFGTTTNFIGNIMALTSITLNTSAKVTGRVLARNGAVTLDTNTINAAFCAVGTTPTSTSITQDSTTNTNTSNQNQTPQCGDKNTIKLPANPHVIRNGKDATVKWIQTEGNQTNIYYRQLNETNWTHAVGDIPSNGYMSFTIHLLKPKVGYVFGIEQKWSCSGGQMVTAVVIDSWKPKLFKFSYWEWSK